MLKSKLSVIVLLLDNRNKHINNAHTIFWVWIVRISTAARRLAVVCLEKHNQHNGRRYILSGSSQFDYFFTSRVQSLSRNVVGTISSTAIITAKSSVVNAGWKKGAVRRRNGWMQCTDCVSPGWKGNQRRKFIGVFQKSAAISTGHALFYATVSNVVTHCKHLSRRRTQPWRSRCRIRCPALRNQL